MVRKLSLGLSGQDLGLRSSGHQYLGGAALLGELDPRICKLTVL